jgi:hypothetical protein
MPTIDNYFSKQGSSNESERKNNVSSSSSSNDAQQIAVSETPNQMKQRKEPGLSGNLDEGDEDETGNRNEKSDDLEYDLDDEEIARLTQRYSQQEEAEMECDTGMDLSQVVDDDSDNDRDDDNNPLGKKPRIDKEKFHANTKDRVTMFEGISAKIFKKSEAYRSKKDKRKILVVDEFILGQPKIMAKCRVYQKVDTTFVGKKGGEILKGQYEYVMERYHVKVEVTKFLGDRCEKPSPTSLFYEETNLKASKNFGIMYTFRKEGVLSRTASIDSDNINCRQRTVLDLFCGAGKLNFGYEFQHMS